MWEVHVVDTTGPGSSTEHERTRPMEDTAEHVRRLRSLPAEHVIGEVVFTLLNAAQVKLGRRDARLLIDLATVAHEHARAYLPDELTKQIDQVLGQLRLGQVSAEGHPSRPAKPEENDLDRVPAPPPAVAAQSPAGPPPSRLWVPGC
jgi:hypothetical protein